MKRFLRSELGASGASGRSSWAGVAEHLGAPLLLVTPFVIFVTYHEYSVLSSEVLWGVLVIVSVGLVASAGIRLGGTALRLLISAGLLTFYLEVQVDWLTIRMIATTYLALLAGCWLLRTRLLEIITGFTVATLGLTLAFPGSTRIGEGSPALEETTATAAALPPLLHLVLDEHIGVAGIPTDIPSGQELQTTLSEFYQRNDFRVFGRAFSQYYDTRNSLANLLNFTSTRTDTYFEGQGGRYNLRENAYFRLLSERGYRLRIYHPDYMRLCDVPDVRIVSCLQYRATSIKSIEALPLGTAQKTRFILRSFLGRSTTLNDLRMRYGGTVRPWLISQGIDPPIWPSDPRMGPISVSPIIDRLHEDIIRSPRGTAFFAHLLTPHHPYVYDADCGFRLNVSEWIWASSPTVMPPRNNTPASRAERYPRYFEQVHCLTQQLGGFFDALKVAGVFEETTIVIHGDHGSRIVEFEPRESNWEFLTPTDYVDAFSTLFVVKSPNMASGYDAHMSPIQDLLASTVGLGPVVDDPTSVFLVSSTPQHWQSAPMVSFGQ